MSKVDLRFNAGVEYKEKIFASAVDINGLFQVDLITHELTYVKLFSKEKACFAIHRTAFLYGNEAWFIPQNGRYIAVVNLDTLDIEYLEPPFRRINEEAISKVNSVYYSGDIFEGKYLYLIPANIDALLVIDLETKKLYPYYDVSVGNEYFLYGIYANSSIYMWPGTGSTVMELNLKTNTKRRFSWEYPIETFADAVCWKNKIWFAPFRANFILMVDLKTKETEKISIQKDCSSEFTYEQIKIFGDKLFFIPFQGDKILELNPDSKEISERYLSQNLLEDGANGFCNIFSQNNIVLASYKKNVILIYDKEQSDLQTIHICIDRKDLIKGIRNNEDLRYGDFLNKDILERENYVGLEDCIRSMIAKEDKKSTGLEDTGKSIWRTINM